MLKKLKKIFMVIVDIIIILSLVIAFINSKKNNNFESIYALATAIFLNVMLVDIKVSELLNYRKKEMDFYNKLDEVMKNNK